jgi:L-lysine exporter family protein LysE/ArgO
MNSANLPLIEGFYLSAGLLVGFGPQSTLILRQGLRRQHLLLMVLLCTLIQGVLIALGTVGVGALIQGEWLSKLMTFAGVATLLYYGTASFRAAFSPILAAQETLTFPTRRQKVTAILAVSLLNPSVYVNTLLLIGGSANHFQSDQRLWFALGAIAASLVWFLGLTYGSALLASVLKQARVLRAIDLCSGALLWFMAFRLFCHMG